MDNVFERIEDSSESESENTSSSSSDDEKINDFSEPFPNHFLNMKSKEEYEKNRNQLFTKDIEVFRILVDSKNLDHSISHNTSNFVFDLHSTNNSSLNNTGGFNRFKNVIGFRLIEAIIPSSPYNVNTNNNKVYIIYNGNRYSFTLTPSNYSNTSLKDELQNKLNSSSTWIKIGNNITLANKNFTVNFNTNGDLKYTTILNESNGDSFHYNFLNDDVNSAYNILGFNRGLTNTLNSQHKSDYVPDISIHYVDVCVPEIPYIACKMNQFGRSILSRIPITSSPGSVIYYNTPDTDKEYEKFFYPISLNKISVELINDSQQHHYETTNVNVSFEFEITVLNNINLLE